MSTFCAHFTSTQIQNQSFLDSFSNFQMFIRFENMYIILVYKKNKKQDVLVQITDKWQKSSS